MRATSSATGPRLAVGHHERAARQPAAPGRARRPARRRRCRRTSCRRARCRSPTSASRPDAGPRRRCGRPAGCRRDPRPGAVGRRRRRAPGADSASRSATALLRAYGPCAWSGSAGSAPAPTSELPLCATDGDETCTTPPTPAARPRPARWRCRSTLARTNCDHRPAHRRPARPGARPPSTPATAAAHGVAGRRRRRGPRVSPSPLGRRCRTHDVVAALGERPRDATTEHAARAGDEDPHGAPTRRPASTRPAHAASAVRSTLELCRTSTGRWSHDEDGGDVRAQRCGGRAHAAASAVARPAPVPRSGAAPGSARRPRRAPARPPGPTPTSAARDTVGQRLDQLLDADRRDRPGRGGEHVHEPSLDPQPALRRRGGRRRRSGARRRR